MIENNERKVMVLGFCAVIVKCLCVRPPHVVCVIYERALEGLEHMSWPNRFQVLWTFHFHTLLHTLTHMYADTCPAQLSIKCRLKHSSSSL